MIYYLILPKQPVHEISDHNIIGEVSFKTFHAGIAWGVLKKLIDQDNVKMLEKISIKTSSNKTLTIEQFLSDINGLRIVTY